MMQGYLGTIASREHTYGVFLKVLLTGNPVLLKTCKAFLGEYPNFFLLFDNRLFRGILLITKKAHPFAEDVPLFPALDAELLFPFYHADSILNILVMFPY